MAFSGKAFSASCIEFNYLHCPNIRIYLPSMLNQKTTGNSKFLWMGLTSTKFYLGAMSSFFRIGEIILKSMNAVQNPFEIKPINADKCTLHRRRNSKSILPWWRTNCGRERKMDGPSVDYHLTWLLIVLPPLLRSSRISLIAWRTAFQRCAGYCCL